MDDVDVEACIFKPSDVMSLSLNLVMVVFFFGTRFYVRHKTSLFFVFVFVSS